MGQRSAIDQLPLTLHDLALLLDPPVVARKDLDEGTQSIGVIIDDLVADLRPRVKNVAIDQVAQQAHVLVILDRHEVDHLEIAPIAEAALGIIDEGVAAAHASGEVSAGPAQDDHNAAGHVLAGGESGLWRRRDDELPTREPLAGIVIGIAADSQGDAPGHEGPEALASAACKLEVDRVLAQSMLAVLLGDEIAEQGSDRPVSIGDRQRALGALLMLD